MSKLPTKVIETDRRLQKSADELMRLRWHWTLDETNPDRVSFRAYAREVGVSEGAVRNAANAWADWLLSQGAYADVRTPGQPQTPQDYQELRKMSSERQEAAKAVAKVTGASVSNVAMHKRDEVDAVVNTARSRAEERGTTVEHEIERAAEWRAKTRRADERLVGDLVDIQAIRCGDQMLRYRSPWRSLRSARRHADRR